MISSHCRGLTFLLVSLLAHVRLAHTFPIWSSNHRHYHHHHSTFQTSTALSSQQNGNPPDTLLIDSGAQEHEKVPHLTVVIPCYNEEFRIHETLESYRNYLASSDRWKDKTSILVVDDGSTDGTVALVRHLGSSVENPSTGTGTNNDHRVSIDCLSLDKNQGKGAALAHGIQEACERYPTGLILTTDADGSANVAGLEDLYDSLVSVLRDNVAHGGSGSDDVKVNNSNDTAASTIMIPWDQAAMINGYRTYESASASRLIFRWGFRTVVMSICGNLGVQDSQCGFKLMTATAGASLYRNLHVQGWSHDVEVLYRARLLGVRVAERSIYWEDKMGSKLVASPGGIIAVCLQMFWQVVRIRFCYASGQWRLEDRD
jgi:dolichyl-phosphate beta-glucosyltransferase